MILLIIVALLVLSYFGFNLRNIVNSPTAQDKLFRFVAIDGSDWIRNNLKVNPKYDNVREVIESYLQERVDEIKTRWK